MTRFLELLAILAVVALAWVVVHATAPRGVSDARFPDRVEDQGLRTAPYAPDTVSTARQVGGAEERAPRPAVAVQAVIPKPLAVTGTATWYCGGGSPCTRGYGPGDLIGAAGSELRFPGWRGSWVRVWAGGHSVSVRLVDVCACPGSRVIDLSRAAFSRLAPASRGEIYVTVERVVALPQTDTVGMEEPR